MKTLVTIGRGGTGKSSFTALMAKAFIEANQAPILLVDADPDQNLAEMLGIDLKEAGKSTILEAIALALTRRINGRAVPVAVPTVPVTVSSPASVEVHDVPVHDPPVTVNVVIAVTSQELPCASKPSAL